MNESAVEPSNQSGASRPKTRSNAEKAVILLLCLSIIGLVLMVLIPFVPPTHVPARLNERIGSLTLVSILTSALGIGQSLLHQSRKLETRIGRLEKGFKNVTDQLDQVVDTTSAISSKLDETGSDIRRIIDLQEALHEHATNTLEHTRVILSLLRQELVPAVHKVLRVSAAAVPWLAWISVLQLLCAAFLLLALTLP